MMAQTTHSIQMLLTKIRIMATTGEQNNDTSAITSPETGDKMNLVLWIALLAVSTSTVIGTAVVNRKNNIIYKQ